MAGDKGAEILKPPPGVKQPPEGFYGQRSSAFKEAAKRALASLGRLAGASFRRTTGELPKPVGQFDLKTWLGPGPKKPGEETNRGRETQTTQSEE